MASGTKTNEREFASQVSLWLTELIRSRGCDLELATCETGIKGLSSTRFGDIVVWQSRAANRAVALVELKTPEDSPYDLAELAKYQEKASQLGVPVIVTWNMREAVVWRLPARRALQYGDQVQVIASPEIAAVGDWLLPAKRARLQEVARQILDAILAFQQAGDGASAFEPTKTYFVSHLRQTVRQLHTQVGLEITKAKARKEFREKFSRYLHEQGITGSDETELNRLVALQVAYRMVGKILFYLMLRTGPYPLPELEIKTSVRDLDRCFEKARDIDYEAIFGNYDAGNTAAREFVEEIPWSAQSVVELRNVITYLKAWKFAECPPDIIGAIYEELIAPEDRHRLGQYFTNDRLSDLILAFCIRNPGDTVLDPGCGTGTFLLRSYSALAHLNRLAGNTKRLHGRLLGQVWGFDIASFPAELATINLTRLDIGNLEGYPHVKHTDFFDVNRRSEFLFPPQHRTWNGMERVKVPMPKFDAVVGNPPYIRQELIDRVKKGTKAKIAAVCREDWQVSTAELAARPMSGNGQPDGAPELSGQSDIYASFFVHSGSLLREGGRLGFVTANSWLDVGYGHALQKFFLQHFKVIALIESRCEPWFLDASVNTTVVILERCSQAADRDATVVKFVKLKQPLAKLIPEEVADESARWNRLLRWVEEVEAVPAATPGQVSAYEDDRMRVRVRTQGELRAEAESAKQTVKWGRILRAPDVYFELAQRCAPQLLPLAQAASEIGRGCKTGINEFFYVDLDHAAAADIEEEFLAPVFKSPKDADAIQVSAAILKTRVFRCQQSLKELKTAKKTGALGYIEWGTSQRSADGVPWPQVPSVQDGRPNWYSLPTDDLAQVFWPLAWDERLAHLFSNKPLFADQRLVFIQPRKPAEAKPLAMSLNCVLGLLFTELTGRVSLGEGALDLPAEEAQTQMVVLDPAWLATLKDARTHFDKLSCRAVLPIRDEVKQTDRRAFDLAVFQALGLSERDLDTTYAGLVELVGERINLGKLRPAQQATAAAHDRELLLAEAAAEFFKDGVPAFPEHYLPGYPKLPGRDFLLPDGEPIIQPFMGQHEFSIGGKTLESFPIELPALFLAHAHAAGHRHIRLPADESGVAKAVTAYERTLTQLRDGVWQHLVGRVGAEDVARSLLAEIWKRQALPVWLLLA